MGEVVFCFFGKEWRGWVSFKVRGCGVRVVGFDGDEKETKAIETVA
jgi:hypothetical protein